LPGLLYSVRERSEDKKLTNRELLARMGMVLRDGQIDTHQRARVRSTTDELALGQLGLRYIGDDPAAVQASERYFADMTERLITPDSIDLMLNETSTTG